MISLDTQFRHRYRDARDDSSRSKIVTFVIDVTMPLLNHDYRH